MRARPDIMHDMGSKEEAKGQVCDAEMFHLASSGRVHWQVLWREVSCKHRPVWQHCDN
jgi:hypothetical protein